MIPIFAAFALIFTGATASAAELCSSPEALLNAAEACAGNGVFADAAHTCLGKLNAEETMWGTKVEAIARKAPQGQNKDTAAALDSYTKTVEAMNHLLALAAQGKSELAAYEPYLALPSLEEASLLDRDGALNPTGALQAGCYASALKAVRESQDDFAAKQATYEKRRAEAIAAAKVLGVNLGTLRAASDAPTPGTARGKRDSVPTGQSRRQESQITGHFDDAPTK